MAEITFEEAVKNLRNAAGQVGISAEEAATAIADGLKKLYNVLGGNATSITGNYSHAEGSYSMAIGNYSHAEGIDNIKLGSGTLTLIPKDIENFTVEKIEIENERWDWLDDTDE